MQWFFWKYFRPFPFCNSEKAADLHSEKLPLEWRVDTTLFFSVKEPGESFQDSTTCEYPLGVQGSINITFSRHSAAALQEIMLRHPISNTKNDRMKRCILVNTTNQRSYDYNQATIRDSNFNNHYEWFSKRKISYSLHQRWKPKYFKEEEKLYPKFVQLQR